MSHEIRTDSDGVLDIEVETEGLAFWIDEDASDRDSRSAGVTLNTEEQVREVMLACEVWLETQSAARAHEPPTVKVRGSEVMKRHMALQRSLAERGYKGIL